MLACLSKVAHERGRPYQCAPHQGVLEGVGYAHISEDNRKAKTGRSEGALL